MTTPNSITRILDADEYLHHQIVNTFDSVGFGDLSWTEKVWASIARIDGTLQLDFGLGKYTNRNVMDGFAGVSKEKEQWTVRASRELSENPESLDVGPIGYEIIEPGKRVRFTLDENDAAAISFDLEYEARFPAYFEDRDVQYEKSRRVSDVVRYHQAGSVSGWIRINGETIEVNPDEWFAIRDHSWGIREKVGNRPGDLQPIVNDRLNFHFHWLVALLHAPDGSAFEVTYYFRRHGDRLVHSTGFINTAVGKQVKVAFIRPRVTYDPSNLGIQPGIVELVTVDDEVETIQVHIEALSDTGFHLQPALYRPWKGETHGAWRGPLSVSGEYIADCDAEYDARVEPGWQLRDRPVKVRVGDAEGYGILESVCFGDYPDLIGTSDRLAAVVTG